MEAAILYAATTKMVECKTSAQLLVNKSLSKKSQALVEENMYRVEN